MNKYELMFILDPNMDEASRAAAIENVKSIIAASGEVSEVNEWGTKKLAYPIQKKAEGYFVVMEFTAAPELPKELDRRLRISDSCMRHIIVSKDEK